MYRLVGIVSARVEVAVLLASSESTERFLCRWPAHSRNRIRWALGQTTGHFGLVIRQGMIRVIYGLSVGLPLALALTRVLTSSIFDVDLLYGVSANDPLTYVLVGALLMVVTLLACYLPARRATRVDPLVALRYE